MVEDEDGRTVWDLRSYDFLDDDPPDTADPNLWRQSQLTRIAGLAGSPRSSTISSSPNRRTRMPAACKPKRSSSSATALKTQPGATFFLMGAKELREGIGGTPTAAAPPDIVANLSVAQLLDAMAIRLDGQPAWESQMRIDWVIADPDEEHALTAGNGVLRHRSGRHRPSAEATLAVDREALDELLLKTADIAGLAEPAGYASRATGRRSSSCWACSTNPTPASPSSPLTELRHVHPRLTGPDAYWFLFRYFQGLRKPSTGGTP